MENERVVHFRVTYTPRVALHLGCTHELDFQDDCRCCSVNKAVIENVDVSWKDDEENLDNRIIFGTVKTTEGRVALARLIAFVRADPEPLALVGADASLEKMK